MNARLIAGLTVGLVMFGGMARATDEATYDASTGVLNIPKVAVSSTYYNVTMQQQGQGLDFSVTGAEASTSNSSANIATYTDLGTLYIPMVVVGADSYTVTMQQQGEGLDFSVTDAVPATSSSSYSSSGVVAYAYSSSGVEASVAIPIGAVSDSISTYMPAYTSASPVLPYSTSGVVGGPPEDFTPAAPARPTRSY